MCFLPHFSPRVTLSRSVIQCHNQDVGIRASLLILFQFNPVLLGVCLCLQGGVFHSMQFYHMCGLGFITIVLFQENSVNTGFFLLSFYNCTCPPPVLNT